MNFDSSAFVAEKELLQALEKRTSTIVCAEERRLFTQGGDPKGLYILRKGTAIMSMESPTGGTLLSLTMSPGSLLGLPALIGSEPYTMTAIAEPGSEYGYVTREDFNSMMLTDPAVAGRVLRVLAAEVRTARHAISEF